MASPAAPEIAGSQFDTGRYDREAQEVVYAYENAQTDDERSSLFTDYLNASAYLRSTKDARLAQDRQTADRRIASWSGEADAISEPGTSSLNWFDVPFFKRTKTDEEVLQDQRRDYVLSRLKEAYPSATTRRDLLPPGYADALDNYDPEYANKRYVGPFFSMENPLGAAMSWAGAIPGTLISLSQGAANQFDSENPVKPYPEAGKNLAYNINTLTGDLTRPLFHRSERAAPGVNRSAWSGYSERTKHRELPWQSQLSLDPKLRDDAVGSAHFMEYNSRTPSFTDHYESLGMPRWAALPTGMVADAVVDPVPGWAGAVKAAKAGNPKAAMRMLRSEAYLPGAVLGLSEGPAAAESIGEKARELIDRLGR